VTKRRSGWSDFPDLCVPEPTKWLLENGLTVLHLPMPGRGLVTTALCYRVGAADEDPAEAGVAHFLEHMMFRGSPAYGEGAIDRATQSLGGQNNAFTSHDATMYHFDFASDRWQEAVVIEADRMRELTLDSDCVESERNVILEEIATSLDDPWDNLDLEVSARLYGGHPYGRSVLGSAETLGRITRADLAGFHERYYLPGNAVFAVVGDVDRLGVEACVEEQFGGLRGTVGQQPRAAGSAPRCSREERLEVRRGSTARLLMAMPGPPAKDPDFAVLSLGMAVLSAGRSSRLERILVEDLEICSSVAAEVSETVEGGVVSISAEVMPGVDPEQVEHEVRRQLSHLAETPVEEAELDRSRSVLLADWVFSQERVHDRALLIASAETLFGSLHPRAWVRGVLECTPARLSECARRFLSLEHGSVVAWSLPESASDES
jgi:zinc protease